MKVFSFENKTRKTKINILNYDVNKMDAPRKYEETSMCI